MKNLWENYAEAAVPEHAHRIVVVSDHDITVQFHHEETYVVLSFMPVTTGEMEELRQFFVGRGYEEVWA